MNPLVKILCYIAAILLVACLLSPPIYWLCHGFTFFEGFPFHRYFTRTAQVTAFALAWPCVRWLHIRSLSELGLHRNEYVFRDLSAGFFIALIPLVLLSGVYVYLDVFHLKTNVSWSPLVRIVLAVIFVSVLEEYFFRGLLLGLALRVMSKWNAILLVAFIFAIVHFLKPSDAKLEMVTWDSGFQHAVLLFSSFADNPRLFLWGMATLLVGGGILGDCTVATRSLWLPIGIHAAWIFGPQTFNLLARYRVKPPEALLPWVGPNLVSNVVPIGIAALIAMALTALLLFWYLHGTSRFKNPPLS
ncbi:MAG: CPBP family intramembrane glutamic endopeptidase [Chthoniobacterales bacterium]